MVAEPITARSPSPRRKGSRERGLRTHQSEHTRERDAELIE
jgi:hypothetical protein